VRMARDFIEKGYKHRLRLRGSEEFRQKVKEALKLIKIAGYKNFLWNRIIEENSICYCGMLLC